MSYLDNELARIEKYIAGLGIKLIKRQKQDKDSDTKDYGSWSPGEIEIFPNEHKTKTDLIMTLLHEIGHHLYYQHNDKPEIPNEILIAYSIMTKAQRKKIYEYEKNGISLMPTIAIELGLKIPLYKIYLQSEFDIWQYEVFYETGEFPNAKERNLKIKELKKLYKGKK